MAWIISSRLGRRESGQRCEPGMRVVAPLVDVKGSRETIVPFINHQLPPILKIRIGERSWTYSAHQRPRSRQTDQPIICMDSLLLFSRRNCHSMETRQKIILLEKIIIQLQHRLVDREVIKHSRLVCQCIHSSCLEALEVIASAMGCRA